MCTVIPTSLDSLDPAFRQTDNNTFFPVREVSSSSVTPDAIVTEDTYRPAQSVTRRLKHR